MRRLVFLIAFAAFGLSALASHGQENAAGGLADLNGEMTALSGSGRHDQAILVGQSALRLAQRQFGAQSREAARQHAALGAVYQSARLGKAAIGELERAIELDREIYGLNSVTLANDLWRLGLAHFSEKDFLRAYSTFGRITGILNRVARGEGDQLANAYFNQALAAGYLAEGDEDVERLHRRSLRIRQAIASEDWGPMARSHMNVARHLAREFRYAEAEKHFRAALAAREKIPDIDRAELADTVVNLADMVLEQKRDDEAAALFIRVLHLHAEAGSNDIVAISYAELGLAKALYNKARYEEAEAHAATALAGAEQRFETDSLELNQYREILALAKMTRGRYAQASELLKRNIETRVKQRGEDDKFLIYMYPGLIASLIGEQKYTEAENTARFLLQFAERVYGSAFLVTTPSVDSLFSLSARILEIQGRPDEAEDQYRRILSSYDLFNKMTETRGDWKEVNFLLRFVDFLDRMKKWRDAAPLVERAFEVAERQQDPDNLDWAGLYDAKALLLRKKGEFAAAEGFVARSLALRKAALRPDHPDLARSYQEAASLAAELGRFREAEDYYRQALAIMTKTHGEESRQSIDLVDRLGALFLRMGRTAEAKQYFGRAAESHLREIDTALLPALAGNAEGDAGKLIGNLYDFEGLLKSNYADHDDATARSMFVFWQWSETSGAASALGQTSVRDAAGNSELAALLRQRQDLVREHQALDRKLIELVSLPYTRREVAKEKEIRDRLAIVAGNVKVVDDGLRRRFPDYAALFNPRPLTIEAVQALLAEDEVLLSYAETSALAPLPAETFLWAIPKRGRPVWVRLSLAPDAIGAKVSALRDLLGVGSGVRAATAISDTPDGDFDLGLAHELYKAVLGPVAPMIAGKQLLIVPSRNLSSLPFQLLVSRAPDADIPAAEAYRRAHWLIRDNAFSVLPSVTSLAAVRSRRESVNDTEAYIGFGNPLLLGADGGNRSAFLAGDCGPAGTGRPVVTAAGGPFNDRGLASFFRGNRADVAEVRKLAPLPETVAEVCAVARSAGGRDDDLFLGRNATEARLKELSASGALAKAKIVHFATHGLVAGDLGFLAEPALVLTPPDTPSEMDDGLLTASEVAQLRLAADWVILSACNTAAGEGNNAEALSGLARAFFYSGARGLLVSHWPVYSDAAVEITTGAFTRLSAQPGMGRAEALRQTLIALIDEGGRHAVPAYWAPFVIIGDVK